MQSPQAYLVLIQNGEQKELFTLSSGAAVMLGRATENTISFLDDRCSRFHAKIYYEGGQWFLQDLGSRNGTYLDGMPVTGDSVPLKPGYRIQIGHTMLQFGCGEPGNADTSVEFGERSPTELHQSGVFGVDSGSLRGPRPDSSNATEIIYQVGHSTILRPEDAKREVNITTRVGYGPVELCRLAFHLGKADDANEVAQLAVEGLLNATGAEGAGLWLLPYSLNSTQRASDIRLVANATLDSPYKPISEQLVCTVFEKKEAFLFSEVQKDSKTEESPAENQRRYGNNTLAVPIRFQGAVLGLIHLYTVADTKHLDESDLEYTLAVADTIGTALSHINKQKELAASLNQSQRENEELRGILQTSSEIIGQSAQIKMIHHLIARAAEGK
ncbi:MAG: FHA domain-containing protein, partial [Planctomycetaceae bacterium]|nr:FHA domain-containing protein [Planctomycetaceae bacterium]